MKHYSIITIALAALLAASCSTDDIVGEQPTQYLQIVPPSISAPISAESPANRAPHANRVPYSDSDLFVPGTPYGGEKPSGIPNYLPYNKLYPSAINKEYTTIGAFLADNSQNEYTSPSGYFKYQDENSWGTTVGIKPGQFYIFGYMPSNTGGISASINRRTMNWADGAVMHIKNLSTVTPADVCVVVGVLKQPEGFDKNNPWGIDDATNIVPLLRQGAYSYKGTEKNNYVYLLLEHLYANVNLELSLDPEYAKLRTIVLTGVYMKTPVKNTVDLDLILGTDPLNPIESIALSAPTGPEPTNARLFPVGQTFTVSSDPANPTSIPGYFAPGMTTQEFDFEFHYDVYDKEGEDLTTDPKNPVFGNCVRKNCVAINKWTLPGTGVQNGKSFKVTATIRPTYLFMLSDPDLDNPTIELNSVTN